MSLNSIVHRGYNGGTLDTVVRRGYAAYSGLPQPPVYQYQTCSSTSFSGYSLQQGSSPAVVIGDVFAVGKTAAPANYTIMVNGDGTVQIYVSGDNTRQSFVYSIFRVASNAIDGPATVWVNEIAPIWNTTIYLNYVQGTFVPIDLVASQYCTSPSGDILAFAVVSGTLPQGLSLSAGGVISGIPNQPGSFQFVISATDSTGSVSNSYTNQINIAQISNTTVSVSSVSAWTADSAYVTADSLGFTCDGANLTNEGSTTISYQGVSDTVSIPLFVPLLGNPSVANPPLPVTSPPMTYYVNGIPVQSGH